MNKPELFEVDLGARKVHIIKFQRPSAQGRHNHKSKHGKPLNKSQAGRAATRWAIPDGKDSLMTGLWLKRTNPYFTGEGGEAKPIPNSIWKERGIEKMKYISWQEFFEISHYKQPGHYSSERVHWNTLASDRKYRNTPLQAFRKTLIDGTNILDLTTHKDQLMYFFALICKNSFLQNKRDKRRYPRAMFYVQEIGAPAQEKYENNRDTDTAIMNLIQLEKKYSSEVFCQFGVILQQSSMTQSPESVYNNLREFVLGETVKGNAKTNCARFNELYEILARKGGRKRFDTMYMFQEMLNSRVIVEESMNFYWVSKRGTDMELLGKSREQVIALLLDADKAHVRQMLQTELKDKALI